MKVVLSRKGFDSQWGGSPSPILPDGTMVSYPIPDEDAVHRYSELRTNSGISYLDLMRQLPMRKLDQYEEDTRAHVDPDLIANRPVKPGWRPMFGQSGSAQGHLINEGVQPGDLFLFYGWFRKTELKDGQVRYVKGAPGQHVLFGYLQVGEVLNVNNDPLPVGYDWILEHPHYAYRKRKQNTVYIARNDLSFDPVLPGAGVFHFAESLVLTEPSYSRSNWRLPRFFHPEVNHVTVSRHSNPERWELGEDACRLKTVAIGQEFVISEHPDVQRWASDIIHNHQPVSMAVR